MMKTLKKVKPKSKSKINKDQQMRNLLKCLEEGDLIPIKNYLNSLLPKKSIRTKTSEEVSEQFRKENLTKETPSERTAKLILRKLKVRFTRQQIVHYAVGKFYILDFYIPEKKLCIEIDGKYHENEEQQKLDKIRTKNLKKLNIEVVRYTNEDVLHPLFEEDLRILLGK